MNLGPGEILVICVIALLVFGPQRLPELARQVGGAMRELRRMQDSVRSELREVLDDDPGRELPRRPSAASPAITDPVDEGDHPEAPPTGTLTSADADLDGHPRDEGSADPGSGSFL